MNFSSGSEIKAKAGSKSEINAKTDPNPDPKKLISDP